MNLYFDTEFTGLVEDSKMENMTKKEAYESVPGIKGVNYPSKDQTTIKNIFTTKDSITAVFTDREKEVEITLYEKEPYVTLKLHVL